MARRNQVKNYERAYSLIASPSSLLAHFLIWQVIVISIYLMSREREKFEPIFSNGLYLGVVGLATLSLTAHLFFIRTDKKFDKQDKIYLTIFSAPILILYFSMFINYDFKSMQSLTLLFILLLPIAIWKTTFDKRDDGVFLKTILSFSLINLVFSILQILNIIPVAQLNSRDLIIDSSDRPTGLLFNAFAMSYAVTITLTIGLVLYLRKSRQRLFEALTVVSSIISLILSGTRTSVWLGFLIVVSTISIKKIKKFKYLKISIPLILILLGVGAPFLLLGLGQIMGNPDWATLNGRTQMWSCVTDKANSFIPFGVGLDDAFPPKFCAESGWFSNLRHPENMFLLAFVESGPLGFVAYVVLFIFAVVKSIAALNKRVILPLAITLIFLLSNLIYVSLFHYLPFLSDRPADRGLFNFYLFYLIWIWVMKESKDKLEKKL
jgi:O-antigen ligase